MYCGLLQLHKHFWWVVGRLLAFFVGPNFLGLWLISLVVVVLLVHFIPTSPRTELLYFTKNLQSTFHEPLARNFRVRGLEKMWLNVERYVSTLIQQLTLITCIWWTMEWPSGWTQTTWSVMRGYLKLIESHTWPLSQHFTVPSRQDIQRLKIEHRNTGRSLCHALELVKHQGMLCAWRVSNKIK